MGFLDTVIPYSTDVEQMGVHRSPLPVSAPRSSVTVAYAQLWDEIQHRLDEPIGGRPPAPKKVRRIIETSPPRAPRPLAGR